MLKASPVVEQKYTFNLQTGLFGIKKLQLYEFVVLKIKTQM
jgi:hypothetical protein